MFSVHPVSRVCISEIAMRLQPRLVGCKARGTLGEISAAEPGPVKRHYRKLARSQNSDPQVAPHKKKRPETPQFFGAPSMHGMMFFRVSSTSWLDKPGMYL